MIIQTKVGKCSVDAVVGYATIATFRSGEHGKKEAGEFAFWTAVLKHAAYLNGSGAGGKYPDKKRKVSRIIGRAQVGFPAGDRFDRMRIESKTAKYPSDRKGYKQMYYDVMKSGENINIIRPSTVKEVRKWMLKHESDNRHADLKIRVHGRQVAWK